MTVKSPTFQTTRWSLAELYPGHASPEIQAAFDSLEARTAAFESRRAELNPEITQPTFLSFIDQIEAATRELYHVYGFANLWFHEDTQNQAAQSFLARVQQTSANQQNRTLFFSLWWKDLDDPNTERLLSGSGEFRYWLEEMRHFKPHTLTEAEEKIVNIKDLTGSTALQTLYDTITNRYKFQLEVDGERKEFTRDGLMQHVYSPNPDLRERAYHELYRVFTQDGPILGQIYQTLVRDWRNENIDLRNFASPIAVRNLANDIPDAVVDTLIDVTRRNAPLFQRFFSLKAAWLGMKKLRRIDIYAPVVQSSKAFAYEEAVDLILAAFDDFEPDLAAMARRVFDQGHMDSELRPGKSSGAFCATVDPALTPWVLMNFSAKARDVATLAHELGHAVHGMLTAGLPSLTFHPSLPLAETASTFAERLLIDRLLAQETDAEVRRDLLFRQMDDAFATVVRQIFFAAFEREAHLKVNAGASVDDLAELYWETLHEQFGEALEIDEIFKWEWIMVPHIYHVPFYVYAYAFGQLLVLALYQQYKREGQGFKPRYLKILAAGGSAAPAEILAQAGVDIQAPGFWQGGFDVLAEALTALEALPLPG